jgi:glycosyltransferase involved in cell wall biosynthesis
MKKITIVMPGSGEGRGQEPVVYNRINALHKDFDLTLLCLQNKKQSDSFIEKIKEDFPEVFLEIIHRKTTITTLIQMAHLFFKKKPMQNALFSNEAIKKSLRSHQEAGAHFIFITSRSYPHDLEVRNFSIDFIDSLSLNIFRKIVFSNILLRPILSYEMTQIKKLEYWLSINAKNSFAVSKIDAEFINKEKVKFLPLGVANNFFEVVDVKKSFDVVFFGNLFYSSNIVAIEYFIESILPKIRQHRNISVVFAGRKPSKKLINLVKCHDITLIENPKSMIDIIRMCKVSIAPMLCGSGMQNKILESMAVGVPVVCNTLGLGTIGARKDKEIMVEDKPDKFAQAILTLLSNEKLWTEISSSGRNYVMRHHRWNSINQQFAEYF